MKSLYFFGYHLNGLEFVTYIIIPIAVILVVLTYIYFNYKYIRLSFDMDLKFSEEQKKQYKEEFEKLWKILYKEEVVNEATKERM